MYLFCTILSYFCVIITWNDTLSIVINVNGNETNKPFLDDSRSKKEKNLISPKMSDEEENSVFVGDHLTCPSCEAVSFQLHRAFSLAHLYKNTVLTESELLELTGKDNKLELSYLNPGL